MARWASAIIRPPIPFSAFARFTSFSIALLVLALATKTGAAEWVEPAEPNSANPPNREFAEPDLAGIDGKWLPIPVEDLESTEGLEEEPQGTRTGVTLRGGIARGRLGTRRISAAWERPGLRTDLGLLAEDGGYAPGARLTFASGRASVAGGRVSVSLAPPLFAEAIGIARIGRRVRGPRLGVLRAVPSLGASEGAIDGGATGWRGAIGRRGSASIWSFAGTQSETREPVGGLGLGAARGTTRVLAAVGSAGRGRARRRVGSITVLRRDRGGSVALEALRSSAGRGLLAEVTTGDEAWLLSARWRYRSWTARRVAAEISVETTGTAVGPRGRLTWRSWSGDASEDDGLLELEASAGHRGIGPAPVRVRLGAAGIGRDGGRTSWHEAYGMVEACLARDARRA